MFVRSAVVRDGVAREGAKEGAAHLGVAEDPAAIARLRFDHPDAKVAVDEGTDDLPSRVRSGELHLAVAFKDLVLRPIAGTGPTRDVYALLAPGGRHPLVAPTLEALDTTTEELQGTVAAR